MVLFPPAFMMPYRPKSKAQIALEEKQAMAATIMTKLATFQPKKKRRKKK